MVKLGFVNSSSKQNMASNDSQKHQKPREIYPGIFQSTKNVVFHSLTGALWGVVSGSHVFENGILSGISALASCIFGKILQELRDHRFLTERLAVNIHELVGPFSASVVSIALFASGVFSSSTAVFYVATSLFMYAAPKVVNTLFPSQIAYLKRKYEELQNRQILFLESLTQINQNKVNLAH